MDTIDICGTYDTECPVLRLQYFVEHQLVLRKMSVKIVEVDFILV